MYHSSLQEEMLVVTKQLRVGVFSIQLLQVSYLRSIEGQEITQFLEASRALTASKPDLQSLWRACL